MARAAGLIAVALGVAGCASEPAACTDLADWRVDLSQGAPIALGIASDGSVYAAIGDAADGVQLASYSLFGGHLVHLGNDGSILAVVPAHEGDGRLAPPALLVDASDDLSVVWRDDYQTTLARYSPQMELLWTIEFAGFGREVSVDVSPAGESLILARDPDGGRRIYFLERGGQIRWAIPVESYSIARIVFGAGSNVYAWVLGTDGALRYAIDAPTGFIVGTASFPSSPTLLRRDGGYIAQTFDMLSRADAQGGETWYRAFTGPTIGTPIASTTGDIVLPVTSADGKYVLLIDQDSGDTRAVRRRCASTVLGAADRDAYYGIGRGGDDPGSISRFPLR